MPSNPPAPTTPDPTRCDPIGGTADGPGPALAARLVAHRELGYRIVSPAVPTRGHRAA
ncbi:hypothetical protein ACIBG0_39400 [Nocardia sp. NPDC050630]|uniref:hypothetical protein n=1 Tax=Nocardia sp. NPDC050630 TaxID=3364321 RepID=UPI0037A24E57